MTDFNSMDSRALSSETPNSPMHATDTPDDRSVVLVQARMGDFHGALSPLKAGDVAPRET